MKRAKILFHPLTLVGASLLVVTALLFSVRSGRGPAYETIVVARGTAVEEVSATGKVKPAQEVDLAFEKGGRVVRVTREVGESVKAGEVILELDRTELTAQLLEAQANVEAEEARLAELLRGTRQEEVQVQEAKVTDARGALADAKRNMVDALRDAYAKADDAIRNKSDQLFFTPRGTPQLAFSLSDAGLETQLESARLALETLLNDWQSFLPTLSPAENLSPQTENAKETLDRVKSFLDNLALAVGSLTASPTLSGSTIDSYKSTVSAARSTAGTAITSHFSAEEKLRSAEADLAIAEKELLLKQAGAAPEAIKSQEAKVKQAEAKVQNIQAQINKIFLRSPIAGVITKEEAKLGEIVAANSPLVAVISEKNLEIESFIPEVDIAKVKIGDAARVTLDAYGNDFIFHAAVAAVDPAETIVEGVATYKTRFEFLEEDERVKPGFTANIDIETARRENVLLAPQSAVISRNGERFVRVLRNGAVGEIKVETGLRGADGMMEIAYGLSEGETIIVSREK